MSNNTNPDP
jgi:hypothetical protein